MSKDYLIHNGQLVSTDELYHYGVLGMKWGVRRATYKSGRNERLAKKALKYDVKAAKLGKKSEKIHSEVDLGDANKKAIKSKKFEVKSAKLEKQASKAEDGYKKSKLQAKAEKYDYKSKKLKIDANRLSKSTGYGIKAMKYSVKSDIVAKKAAKARMKMAKNEHYIKGMKRKVSSLSKEELQGAYNFVNELKSI